MKNFEEYKIVLNSFMNKNTMLEELMQILQYEFFRHDNCICPISTLQSILILSGDEIDFEDEELDDDTTILIKIEFESITISLSFNGNSSEREIEEIIVYNKK